MSTQEPSVERRDTAAGTVAGILAAVAIFAGAISLIEKSGRVGVGAMGVALLAVAIGGRHRKLAAISLVLTTTFWLAGMIIAVTVGQPIF